jgi:hypothetical protein
MRYLFKKSEKGAWASDDACFVYYGATITKSSRFL